MRLLTRLATLTLAAWAAGPVPVSYTHLDVYKRQVQRRPEGRSPLPAVPDFFWVHCADGAEPD